jgi:hypothetical protein
MIGVHGEAMRLKEMRHGTRNTRPGDGASAPPGEYGFPVDEVA